jgi:hypothetical protein
LAVGCGVGEVVLTGHIFAVSLRGVRELCVGLQGALAVLFAFPIDEAEDRFADEPEVTGPWGQVGVCAGGGGVGCEVRCGRRGGGCGGQGGEGDPDAE